MYTNPKATNIFARLLMEVREESSYGDCVCTRSLLYENLTHYSGWFTFFLTMLQRKDDSAQRQYVMHYKFAVFGAPQKDVLCFLGQYM